MRVRRTSVLLGAVGVSAVLAACSPNGDAEDQDTETGTEEDAGDDADDQGSASGDTGEDGDGGTDGGDADGQDELEDMLGDMEDPNELVEDDVFRGAGIRLPTPEDWELNQMAYAQGLVVSAPEDGSQQLAGQAVDVDTLPEELTFDELLESNRGLFPSEPTLDEEVELEGAEQARQVRYEDLPAEQEGQEPNSVMLLVADDGDGRLAVFNYLAPAEDYDEETEELLLSAAGFDPDSEPVPPQPAPEQGGGEQLPEQPEQ